MKVTPRWINDHLPFLVCLLQHAKVEGKKKIVLTIKTDAVIVPPISYDGIVRYGSAGETRGQSVTSFFGSNDTAANRPSTAFGTDIDGYEASSGRFCAIFDVHEYYGIRNLTVWMNMHDLQESSQVLKNQLKQIINIPPPVLA